MKNAIQTLFKQMAKKIIVMFGGISPEHEVSIISGLQTLENIDRKLYEPYAIYVTKTGELQCLGLLSNRKQFFFAKRVNVSFGRDIRGGYIELNNFRRKKVYPYAAYLAFHGGLGEGGGIQGLLESFEIPYTSTSQESAVITMNKQLTKEQVTGSGIEVIAGINLFSTNVRADSQHQAKLVEEGLGLPVIIKPVHLGSSIGIKVARTLIELEKVLLEAAFIDNEILVEKYMTDFTEYNCAVRLVNGELQASEVERPKSQDEILSFADKYQRGSKKTGGSGMASLQRELPAKISEELRERIQETAKKAFIACRCKSMVRIDFMHTKNDKLLLTEINPIPGSMAFYLWEASGLTFKQQITDLIEQSVRDTEIAKATNLQYQSDIVEEFVHNQ